MDDRHIVAVCGASAIMIIAIFSVLFMNFNSRKDTNEKTISFIVKKYSYLSTLLLINVCCGSLIILFPGVKAVAITFIVLKSKDILTALSLTCFYIFQFFKKHILRKETVYSSVIGKSIVTVIPVYSETKQQVDTTINSVIDNNIEDNKNLMLIICDGLDIAIEESLTEVIQIHQQEYVSWKGTTNTLNIIYGNVRNTPCVIVKKVLNQGKRDTLILAHNVFGHIGRANIDNSCTVLREQIRACVSRFYSVDNFDFMFCTDADTTITQDSYLYLIQTIETRNAIACCGLVVVNSTNKHWKFWNLFQNFQYLYGQHLWRNFENTIGKVTCLPGCMTMLKLNDECANAIAAYSNLPCDKKMIESTVQLLGTDRRLTSLLMNQSKDTVTSFDRRAKCYTIPPQTFYTYVSQRRRWASNAYFNTMCNITGANIHPITRFFASLDYIRMSLVYFRIFNTIMFVYQLTQPGLMLIEILPFMLIVFYPPIFVFAFSLFDAFLRSMFDKLIVGYVCNKIVSPFVSVIVLSNFYYNIGSVKWGGNQTQSINTSPDISIV
jgi:chitin synthase